jgi:hypothetical protein
MDGIAENSGVFPFLCHGRVGMPFQKKPSSYHHRSFLFPSLLISLGWKPVLALDNPEAACILGALRRCNKRQSRL